MTDITIENYGTIFLFFAHTPVAREWIKNNVETDYDETIGPLVVEHRFAEDIAVGMINDGLEVI